jgi:hypothetical protein
MPMIRGKIGPKGRPGHIHPYLGGHLNLYSEREFIVDEKAARVVDEKDKPLVLTPKVYAEICEAIKGGAAMFVEPVVDDGGATVAELEEGLREAVAEIERRGQVIEERDRDRAEAERALALRDADLEQLRARLAAVEAERDALVVAAAKPAAKPEKAKK